MLQKYKDFRQHRVPKNEHDQWRSELEKKNTEFDYTNIDSVTLFEGTHPAVMGELVNKEDWKFDPDIKKRILRISSTACFIFYHKILAGGLLSTAIIKEYNFT